MQVQQINLADAVVDILKGKLSEDNWSEYVPIIKVSDTEYVVYILDAIESPDNYTKLLHLLNTAGEGVTIRTYLNTPGGWMDTAEMLYTAYKNSKANTIAYVTGTVASAGTIITLGNKQREINPLSVFMIHESSGGVGGKQSDMQKQTAFHTKRLAEFYKIIYSEVLSVKEIARALKGEELWFTGNEITERLARVK